MSKGKPATFKPESVNTNINNDTINLDVFPIPDSNQENTGLVRNKGRLGKAIVKKSIKFKAVGRRISDNFILSKKAVAKKKTIVKRASLKEKTSTR